MTTINSNIALKLRVPSQGLDLTLQPDDPPLVIGRGKESGVLFTDQLVSTSHARVWHDGVGWLIEDLGSTNGTFVDGVRTTTARLDDDLRVLFGDPRSGAVIDATPVTIMRSPSATSPGAVAASTNTADGARDLVFAVQGLTVETAGVVRLDRVTFSLPRGSMLGVLGGSGAGKSTLVKAITGSGPATSGRVLFEGYDLYENFDYLRRRLGYVPQDDILHTALTVSETLEYSARLRMPEVSPQERRQRATEVVEELGLAHRADARVAELSGGQRKRLNVGLELLAKPALLLLDEPTSGLDPANERSLMKLLRELANGGRTVIVVTHNTESLHLCDDVMVLARGGVPVYLGPEEDLAAEFKQPTLIDAFAYVDNHPEPATLRAGFDEDQLSTTRIDPTRTAPKPTVDGFRTDLTNFSGNTGRDTWTLLQRSIDILRGDSRNTRFIALQAPLIGGIVALLFHGGVLDTRTPPPDPNGPSLVLIIVLSVIFLGSANTVREIVKERPIMLREQSFGVSSAAYLASKALLWSGILVIQALLIVLTVTVFNAGPDVDLLGLGAVNELAWVVMLTGLVAVASGLLISSLVTSNDKAMTLLPVYLFVQLLLAGLIVPVHEMPMRMFSWFVTSKWGLDGAGSVSNLWYLRSCDFSTLDNPIECSANWHHEWYNLVLALVMLTVSLGVTYWMSYAALRRTDPARALAAREAYS